VHHIELDRIEADFPTKADYDRFINSLRTSHCLQFAQPNGKNKTDTFISYTLHCHCSANTKDERPERERKSNRAPIRSAKSNAICTAYLQVSRLWSSNLYYYISIKIKENLTMGNVYVRGCLQHDGHLPDIARLQLTNAEKQILRQHLADERSVRWIMEFLDS